MFHWNADVVLIAKDMIGKGNLVLYLLKKAALDGSFANKKTRPNLMNCSCSLCLGPWAKVRSFVCFILLLLLLLLLETRVHYRLTVVKQMATTRRREGKVR